MSEKIFCGKCNNLLYFGEEIARRLYMRAVPSEETLLANYHNKCPRCGSELKIDTVNIEITRRERHAY